MRKEGESPQGFEGFHLELTGARWHNLVCMEYSKTIKSMLVGFCFIQDFMDGYIKP